MHFSASSFIQISGSLFERKNMQKILKVQTMHFFGAIWDKFASYLMLI